MVLKLTRRMRGRGNGAPKQADTYAMFAAHRAAVVSSRADFVWGAPEYVRSRIEALIEPAIAHSHAAAGQLLCHR